MLFKFPRQVSGLGARQSGASKASKRRAPPSLKQSYTFDFVPLPPLVASVASPISSSLVAFWEDHTTAMLSAPPVHRL